MRKMRHGEAMPETDGLPLRGRNPRRRPYAFKTAHQKREAPTAAIAENAENSK
jgi:hypothetical protein